MRAIRSEGGDDNGGMREWGIERMCGQRISGGGGYPAGMLKPRLQDRLQHVAYVAQHCRRGRPVGATLGGGRCSVATARPWVGVGVLKRGIQPHPFMGVDNQPHLPLLDLLDPAILGA